MEQLKVPITVRVREQGRCQYESDSRSSTGPAGSVNVAVYDEAETEALRFHHLQLSNCSFRIIVVLLDEDGVYMYCQKSADYLFTIRSTEKEWGLCHLTHTWQLEAAKNENAG